MGEPCYRIENEANYFKSSSGLALPESATVLLSCSEQITFSGEREYYAVADVPSDFVKELLQTGLIEKGLTGKDWKRGPIPVSVRKSTALNLAFDEEFKSSDVFYAASGNGTYGKLLILDPPRNKVFYSQRTYSPPRELGD